MTDNERAVWMSVFGPAYIKEQYVSYSCPARSADFETHEAYLDELIRRDFDMAAQAAAIAGSTIERLRKVMEPGGMLDSSYDDAVAAMAREAMEVE